MNRLFAPCALAALWLIVGPGQVEAEPITYSFTGTGTGTVGGNPFTNATFTITVFADTADVREVQPGNFSVGDLLSTIEIAGFELGVFTTGKRVFDNQNVSALGFASEIGPDLLDLFEPPFATYDLRSSFGPVFEPTPSAFSQFVNQPSTLGLITLTSARDVTFVANVASVVPEPSTLVLLGVGAAIVIGPCLRRRR